MKDTLVCYKGGGYDGCHWEWNYFLWNEDGEFEVLYATGYKGIVDEETARNLEPGDRFSVHFTDLIDADEVVEFVDSTNASHVKMLTDIYSRKFRATLRERYTFIGTCQGEDCDLLLDVNDMHEGGWAGDGHGVTYSAHYLYCDQCSEEES